MDSITQTAGTTQTVLQILEPDRIRLPVILASPHSGHAYEEAFVRQTRLSLPGLRKSEDCFVDEIFMEAHRVGIPLIRALFPRAFIDVNREPFELDPTMFRDALPSYVNARSPRVAAGLGTIARVVANGENIYRGKLAFAEALDRIHRYYYPYHEALRSLLDQVKEQHGRYLLIDCHSMPSGGGPNGRGPGTTPDFVLGDCFGTACEPAIVDAAERYLTSEGYRVQRNTPYAGGYTTRHYGTPGRGNHAIQVEINRSLYMNEQAFTRKPYLETLRHQMTGLVERLGALAQNA